MRNSIILCVYVLFLQSCNKENAWDCIQTVGDIVEISYDVSTFSKITVEDDIFLEIEQGDVQEVILTTGSNLVNDISIVVEENGVLRLKNNNSCNLTREYDVTVVKVTTPVLTEIRSASWNPVRSLNILTFDSLRLNSNTNPGVVDSGKNGDFFVSVDLRSLSIEANGLSLFKITGRTKKATLAFTTDLPKFEGEDLIIQDLFFRQVSNRDMIVNPQESIVGSIRSTGNVISLNKPPIVDVEERFTGRLIFQ